MGKKPGHKKLSPKQALFVQEYLVDLNAAASARRAGYKPKWVATNTDKLLTNTNIQAAIRAAMDKRSERTEITQDRVLQEYARLAFLDPRQFADEDGNLLPLHKLSTEAAAAVSGFDAKRIMGEDGDVCEILKYKFVDKRASLSDVAKHLGMFEKDNRQKGNHEIIVTVETEDAD